MKIIYAGEQSGIAKSFLEKMHKEGHDVYFLSEEDFSGDLMSGIKYRFFKLGDKQSVIKRIVSSINPQVVVLGEKMFAEADKMENINGYFNFIIEIMRSLKGLSTEKVVFLSSTDVYGETESRISETTEVCPRTNLAIYMSQAENIVKQYAKTFNISSIIVRVGNLYDSVCVSNRQDFLSCCFDEVLNSNELSFNSNKLFFPLHMDDLIEGLKKIIELPNKDEVYNITGSTSISAEKVYRLASKVVDKNTPFKSYDGIKNELIENTKFKKDVEWADIKEFETLFSQEKISFEKTKELKVKKEKKKVNGLRRMLENLFVFIVFASLQYFTGEHMLFGNVNWFIIYIVLIGLLMGSRQSAFAVIMSSLTYLFLNDLNILEMTNFHSYASSILVVVEFVFLGLITGYTTDMMRNHISDLRKEQRLLNDEFETLKEIDDQNIIIKNEYEKRLLSTANSIPTLYSLIEKIMVQSSDKIFVEILDVITSLVNTKTVAVYRVNGTDTRLRLINALNDDSVVDGKSWDISKSDSIQQALKNGTLYEGDVWQGEPAIILPILHEQRPMAAIVIKKLGYNEHSLYSLNILRTMSLMIVSSVVRALEYENITRAEKYISGTELLKSEEFANRVMLAQSRKKEGIAEFTLLKIKSDSRWQEVYELIRVTDCIGVDKNNNMFALLDNADSNDSVAICARWAERGIDAVEVISKKISPSVNSKDTDG